jgi:predicted transcriptional regulator
MVKRRSKIDIVNDMLTAIEQKGHKIKPTHLMYKSNLSHKLMVSYLEELIEKDMVKEIEQGGYKYLIITDKGLDFTFKFRKMKEFADSFGI